MSQIILINVSGPDRPGVTASISAVLAGYGIQILDIGQAVIHDTLALGILIEATSGAVSAPILKDVLYRAHELGVQLRFTPVDLEDYERWVGSQGKQRHIVTLLARRITAEHIARVSRVISDNGLNIDAISRLSGRVPLMEVRSEHNPGSSRACVEFSVRGTPADSDGMRREFLNIARGQGVDIAFQEDNVYRRTRRLVCFDMDSTLIETEVIDELAKRAGVGREVAAITEAAMRGELDFTESFRKRVALLKGLDEGVLKEIAAELPLTEGAVRLITTLKRLGYKTAILSGGFTYFGRHLQKILGIDYVYANELEIENGRVTGQVSGAVVDGKRKAELLREIAARENIRLEQVIAVGDGSNDLPMLGLAGLGIAFRAKPIVKENAEQAITTLGLDGILYLIGVRDRDRV